MKIPQIIDFTDKDGNDTMQQQIDANYYRIKNEVRQIVADEITGIELNKQLTPVFGFSLEAIGSFNTSRSRTAFDRSNVSLLGLVNLNNLFGTYTGVPRPFEIEAVAGIGWLHYYMNREAGSDQNSMSTKLGLNFNFNLGESKAWTLALKPALVYDMNAVGTEAVSFHSGRAVWEISVGLKYHFGCSNGKHHFTKSETLRSAGGGYFERKN